MKKKTNSKKTSNGSVEAEQFLVTNFAQPSIAFIIKDYRELYDLTQKEFGEKIGASKQHVNNIEKGLTKLSIEKAIEYAEKIDEPITMYIKASIADSLKKAGHEEFNIELNVRSA